MATPHDVVIVVPEEPRNDMSGGIHEKPRNDMSGGIRLLLWFLLACRLRLYVVPDGPQIRVIREEPRNDMSGRINNLMNAYLTSHAAILTSVFSLQGPIGAEIWRSVVLLSGAVSVLIILLLLHIYFQQFNDLTSGGRGEPGLLNSLVQNSRWIAERSAFVLMLMALSICLLYTYSRLLLSRIP